jgi:hypothetical protein
MVLCGATPRNRQEGVLRCWDAVERDLLTYLVVFPQAMAAANASMHSGTYGMATGSQLPLPVSFSARILSGAVHSSAARHAGPARSAHGADRRPGHAGPVPGLALAGRRRHAAWRWTMHSKASVARVKPLP